MYQDGRHDAIIFACIFARPGARSFASNEFHIRSAALPEPIKNLGLQMPEIECIRLGLHTGDGSRTFSPVKNFLPSGSWQ